MSRNLRNMINNATDYIWELNELVYDGREVFPMDEFNDIVIDPWEATRMAFNGGRYGFPYDSFVPHDEYFTFNGAGNLVSIQDYTLTEYYAEYIESDEEDDEEEGVLF